ncbi:MAG: DUF4886 domain-containing protein [Sandaracinaceae bacterium]
MRVLFVGNSYTFYNDMSGQVARLAEGDDGAPSLETDRVAEGGASLRHHFEASGARARIEEGGWTHVVLQERSTGSLHSAAEFHDYVGRLAKVAARTGALVLLYETWARQAKSDAYRARWSGGSPPEMMRRIRAEYAEAGAALGARVVPVGTAWERALAERPQIVLHDTDLHHASPLGSHLAAAVFYVALTGRDPRGSTFAAPGVNEDDATFLRRIAFEVTGSQLRD